MTGRPLQIPAFATDATFVAAGKAWDGAPNKSAPAPSKIAEGFEPSERPPADVINWLFNAYGAFFTHLADIQLRNWDVRAADSTGTPLAVVSVAANGTGIGLRDAFLAVLDGTTSSLVQVSPDGIHWIDSSTGIGAGHVLTDAVAFVSASKWLVVGETGRIYQRALGSTGSWTQSGPGTGADLRAVACRTGVAVAVGDSGRILTSPDGTTWTSRTSGTAENLVDVVWGNGTWLAVGENGAITYSTDDGATWTAVTLVSFPDCTHVLYDAVTQRFVVFLNVGTGAVYVVPSTIVSGGSFAYDVGVLPKAVAVTPSGMIAAVFSQYVAWSADDGRTWSSWSQMPREDGAGSGFVYQALAFSSPHGCFVAGGDGTGPMLAQSLRAS
jgi:hypothetical protein